MIVLSEERSPEQERCLHEMLDCVLGTEKEGKTYGFLFDINGEPEVTFRNNLQI